VKGTRLDGSTVLITGAGSGIGRLMALGAAQRGASLVLWDLSPERVEKVRAEIADRAHPGAPVLAQVVDVSDKAQVSAAAAETLAQVGAVDVLINNAGVISGKPLLDTSDAAIERTFAVNVLALYWVTRAFLPAMVAQHRGHVVTIASAAGLIGVAQQTDYSASKHAAVGFDESLRAEMRTLGTGVRTTVVCPYYIDTGMFDGVATKYPFLLPILKEQKVATKILDAVERGKSRLIMPPLVAGLAPARILPTALFDRMNDFLGVNQTMAHFAGRPGDAPVVTPDPVILGDAAAPGTAQADADPAVRAG
jgi:all-trans-retinol dehydrogenase (NAD+)